MVQRSLLVYFTNLFIDSPPGKKRVSYDFSARIKLHQHFIDLRNRWLFFFLKKKKTCVSIKPQSSLISYVVISTTSFKKSLDFETSKHLNLRRVLYKTNDILSIIPNPLFRNVSKITSRRRMQRKFQKYEFMIIFYCITLFRCHSKWLCLTLSCHRSLINWIQVLSSIYCSYIATICPKKKKNPYKC